MKKMFTLIMVGLIIIIVYMLYDRNIDYEKDIVADLVHLGTTESENAQKLTFTLYNDSNRDVELKFRSPLEYNYSFDIIRGKNVEAEFEHLDLNLDPPSNGHTVTHPDSGRTVILPKNDSISYTFLIHHLESGTYEINISSDSGYGGNIKKVFVVE